MKTIETLDGTVNSSGTFTENVGILTPLIWTHPDTDWTVRTTLGYGGLKCAQDTTEIAITFAELFALLVAKEPNLLPQLPTPVATPASGAAPQTVALTCAQAGATIRYTTNGTTPTAASTAYTTPISIASAATLKAVAFRTNWQPSAVGSWPYT